MPNTVKVLKLTTDEKNSLECLLRCPTTEARKYIRAKILLLKSDSYTNEAIADKLDITVPTVRLCLQKYFAGGIDNALNDCKGKGRKQEISDDDITWVVNKACQKPLDYGFSAEFWYPASFTRFIQSIAVKEGHPRLEHVSEFSLRKILANAKIRPFKVTYYCEKRDYEYIRYGTISLLAAIDLLTGEAIPLVSDTHKSSDFVEFLTRLDAKYPEGDKIRLILDNHSAHTSQETQRYLNNHLGRFEFVFTPTHGFWLNLVEGFFSKLTKQMLQGIRVASKEELSERIYKYFDEINQIPIPYHGSYNLDSIDLATEDIDQIVYEVVNAKAASEELSCKRAPKPIKRSPKKSAKTEN